jgi:hypothetical protein
VNDAPTIGTRSPSKSKRLRAGNVRDAVCNACAPVVRKGKETLQVGTGGQNADGSSLRSHPENSDPENLVAVCSACHLAYHAGGRSNVSPGQLSLWSAI